jgi:tetratricopeptide (TPR) repeat protein
VTALPADRRASLLERYRQFRQALTRYAVSMRPRDPSGLTVPVGFPGEFEDYLQGAVAYHEGRLAAARASWEKLLSRPAGERRYRSTWAAYMLGKASLVEDPEVAARWFAKTRELAAQGFSDPLGLAAESLGWQARVDLDRKAPVAALVLYLQQVKTGDPTAVNSIRFAGAEILRDPEALRKVARSDQARPILTACVLSSWDRMETQDWPEPLDPAPAKAWLDALRAAGVTQVEDADRLAWVAYRAGDFAAAEDWLRRAPAEAPMTLWVRAKLRMRDGRLAEAEKLLARALPALPPDGGEDHDLWRAYEQEVKPAIRPRASGELGAVRLARGEYVAALDALVRGGYWSDAAYVAERELTVGELQAYVDRTFPAGLAARYKPASDSDPAQGWDLTYAGLAAPEAPEMAHDLRYLLGRRLARAGRYGEAQRYLPAEEAGLARRIAAALSAGRDPHRSRAVRSRSLFEAACLTRHHGMEVLGTEIDPDWELYGGGLSPGDFTTARLDPAHHRVFAATADERQRAARHRPRPDARFHYRYRGADLAWEAAALLPDGSNEKARMLAVAGSWIERQDPQAADRFYKRLVRCCANTELGREADALRWFPEVEDCAP